MVISQIPTTIGQAPDKPLAWYQRMDLKWAGNLQSDRPFSGTIPGYTPAPTTINIYPRDVQEVAREVGMYLWERKVRRQLRAVLLGFTCPVCKRDVPWIPDGGAQLRSSIGGE